MRHSPDPRQRGIRVRPLIASTRFRQFLFLASHGLRNPLTAINWSYGRLQKSGKHSAQEQYYLDQIRRNVLRLSRMLSGLFLLAGMDDAGHRLTFTTIQLQPMLTRVLPPEQRTMPFQITCDPSVQLRTDTQVCSVLFSSLFAGCEAARRDPQSLIAVSVTTHAHHVHVRCTLRAYLEYLTGAEGLKPTQKIVGGTPGLLFAMARELTVFLGGEFFCLARETEEGDQAGDAYVVTVVLPLSLAAAAASSA